MYLLLLLAGLGTGWLFYRWYVRAYRHWSDRGIPAVPNSFPFGSSRDYVLGRKFIGHAVDDMYRSAAPHPYFGIISMRVPTLVLRDPEIIRLVMAKEFSHFRDRQGFKVPKTDILGNHLFNLEGERWRALRVKLSPTFTSGKLKGMFQHFVTCAQAFEELLQTESENKAVDVKDIIARFTTDTICNCAFGLDVSAVKDSNSEFRKLTKDLFKIEPGIRWKLALIRAFPILFLLRIIRPSFTPKHVEKYFYNLIKSTVEHRETTQEKRNDFMDLLIQLKQNKGALVDDTVGTASELEGLNDSKPTEPMEMTVELMTSQCFVFLFAGFETSSSVQSFSLYELAVQPEIQDRLRGEIEETIAKHGGQLTYQAIQEMQYLDMVVNEAMRKYPTLMFLTRVCTKDFMTPQGHLIKKGDRTLIPTWSLHHDPEYFPEPERFDPERFSKENKDKIKSYTYLPFGEGPRICIGMRFGLLQTKVGLITVLRKYRLEPAADTKIPLELSPESFLLTSTKGPITLKMTKI